MVSFAWNVGHGLTYKVLTDDTQQILCRSRLLLALDAKNKVEEARRMQPCKEHFFLDSKHSFNAVIQPLRYLLLKHLTVHSSMMMMTRVLTNLLLPQALHQIGERMMQKIGEPTFPLIGEASLR